MKRSFDESIVSLAPIVTFAVFVSTPFAFRCATIRPSAGSTILTSTHFPEEYWGDYLNPNCIGFQGIYRVNLEADGSGIKGTRETDIVQSTDFNFRPIDTATGPDGALYVVDWHNPLIGHLQSHLRDSNRDHEHGRIYRITYEGRPLAWQPKIDGEPSARLVVAGAGTYRFESPQLTRDVVLFATRPELNFGWILIGDETVPQTVRAFGSRENPDPVARPVLEVDTFIRYQAALKMQPSTEERLEVGPLPQHYADMFGWEELAGLVETAYQRLTPKEQARCRVFGQNYGEAGAIDVIGRKLGLPRAMSGHNSYWLWGPGDFDGQVLIIIGGDREDNARFFEEIEIVGQTRNPYAMPYERGLDVSIARRPKGTLREAWPMLRHFI